MKLIALEGSADEVVGIGPTSPAVASGDAAALARQLAADVADAADADQWAIAVVGLPDTGDPDFEEMVPRPYLEAMNQGRPARYRITLVLQAGGRDLGVLRLGTIRPNGFSDTEIARARAEAAQAAVALAEVIRPAVVALREIPAARTDERQGIVNLGTDRVIRAMSPVAEDLLGWRSEDVTGKSCAAVLSCRDRRGRSLCGRCGLAATGDRHGIVPSTWMRMRMADPMGQWRTMSTSFWFLPTSRASEARIVLVVRAVPTPPGAD